MEKKKETRTKRTAAPAYSKAVQESLERARQRKIPMSREEMKRYTAAELERLMPGVFNKLGYWMHSKDSDIPLITVLDWKAAMK